jgi:hypothetical protein
MSVAMDDSIKRWTARSANLAHRCRRGGVHPAGYERCGAGKKKLTTFRWRHEFRRRLGAAGERSGCSDALCGEDRLPAETL